MLRRVFSRQLAAAATMGLLVSACGFPAFFQNTSGAGIPSPYDVAAYRSETVKAAAIDGKTMSAKQYLISSISFTNEKCHKFFETLEKFKQDSEMIDRVISAAIAAGSPLAAFGMSPKALATTTSGVSFANLINKDTAAIYAFADFKEQLKEHVFDSLASYQEKLGEAKNWPESQLAAKPLDEPSQTDALVLARSMAADYASLCSLAHMKKIVVAALAKTATTTKASQPLAPVSSQTLPKQ